MGKEGFSDSEEYNSNSSECSSREESYESNQDLTTLDSESIGNFQVFHWMKEMK